LLGRHFSLSQSGDSRQRAVAALEKAIELDPHYSTAWAALVDAYVRAGSSGVVPWGEARRKARAAADRAVELAPNQPETLAARARARIVEWDWVGAKSDLDRAAAFGPDDPRVPPPGMASYLNWMGRASEAAELLRRHVELEPLDGTAWNSLGVNYAQVGQFDEAERAFARALEVDPRNEFVGVNRSTARIYAGRPAEALAYCEAQGLRAAHCTAMAHHALGNAKDSQKALDALLATPEGNTIYAIARVYAFRGQPDPAFEWLERARAGHVRSMNMLRSDRSLRSLHSDPRWAELLRKVNLPVD
jgi:Flp pilus assembly protein TadD